MTISAFDNTSGVLYNVDISDYQAQGYAYSYDELYNDATLRSDILNPTFVATTEMIVGAVSVDDPSTLLIGAKTTYGWLSSDSVQINSTGTYREGTSNTLDTTYDTVWYMTTGNGSFGFESKTNYLNNGVRLSSADTDGDTDSLSWHIYLTDQQQTAGGYLLTRQDPNTLVKTPVASLNSSQSYRKVILYRDGSAPNVPLANICFHCDTPIKTDQGIVKICELNKHYHTIRNSNIEEVTRTIGIDNYLVKFTQGALYNNVPSQDTVMTGNHRVFYRGQMIPAKQFLGRFEGVKQIPYDGSVLYNILLDGHNNNINVNNLLCETLHPENEFVNFNRILKSLRASPEAQRNFITQRNKALCMSI